MTPQKYLWRNRGGFTWVSRYTEQENPEAVMLGVIRPDSVETLLKLGQSEICDPLRHAPHLMPTEEPNNDQT